jgi:putative ABC transport system permease protein
MAMGATASNVIGMVMGQTGRMVGAGGLVGLAGAVVVARGLESFLFGVTTLSPLVLLAVVLVIVVAGSLAALLPARRACMVDATLALRED